MDRTYEALLDENNELRKALNSTKELVERFRSDNESLKQMHEEFKLHHERLKKECQEAHNRCAEAVSSRKETEAYYENYVSRLKNSLEQRKKEFDEMQSKMIPPIDSELLRVKLVNEIEGPMRVAIENKQEEVNRLNEQYYEITRKHDLLQLEFNTYKTDIEKEIRDTKDRHSKEVNQYFAELQELQTRIDDPSDKETIRALKKDREELRVRLEKLHEEVEEVRKSREQVRQEKNEVEIKLNKDVEEEHNKYRTLNIQKDKLEVQNKDFQEQTYKLKLNYDSKVQELLTLKKDHENAQSELENYENQVTMLQQEISDLQKKLQEKESQIDLKVREVTRAEKEKSQQLKDEKEKLQKQLEEVEYRERQINSKLSSTERNYKHELERKGQEISNFKEDYKLLESRNQALSKEVDLLKGSYNSKTQESEKVETEFKQLQQQLTEVTKREEQLTQTKDKLQEALNKAQEELAKRPEAQETKQLEERCRYLEAQLHFYKNKCRDYKQRVRQANEKIQELGIKFARSELERQKLQS